MTQMCKIEWTDKNGKVYRAIMSEERAFKLHLALIRNNICIKAKTERIGR